MDCAFLRGIRHEILQALEFSRDQPEEALLALALEGETEIQIAALRVLGPFGEEMDFTSKVRPLLLLSCQLDVH